MLQKRFKHIDRSILIHLFIIALTALGLGLSHDIFQNYFKEAYNISTYQRGIIEFPREIPGVLVMFVVAGLSFISDIRVAMISQVLSIIGIIVLGLFTPSFNIMLIFIFINSMGMHLFMPLRDSIGISLIKDDNIGKWMGCFKGTFTGFTMLGSIITLIGFKVGFFSFTSRIKWIFIISGIFFILVLILLFLFEHVNKEPIKSNKKIDFIFRKEYKYYYILVVMFGVQKQMMIVYGPWVLIELLGKKAITMSILNILGSFVGIFFIPAVGRWLDRFGIKTVLYADALSFIGVYFVYGLMSAGFSTGTLSQIGLPLYFTYFLFLLDKMSTQLGMVRTIYLRSIVIKASDIKPTLSLGISMDHAISILSAYICGIIWSAWGAQYVFFCVAALSFVNLYVATKVDIVKT